MKKKLLPSLLLLFCLPVLAACLQFSPDQKLILPVVEMVTPTHTPMVVPTHTTNPPESTLPTATTTPEAHSFYLLEGEHATLECQACHPDGLSGAASANCLSCHRGKISEVGARFDCVHCHQPNMWPEALAEHTDYETTACVTCHEPHFMPPHLPGHCSDCHATGRWQVNDKELAEAVDCTHCHSDLKPRRHYNEQCGLCHVAQSWAEVSFEHTGFTNCEACHRKPRDHTNNRCGFCHSTLDWASGS